MTGKRWLIEHEGLLVYVFMTLVLLNSCNKNNDYGYRELPKLSALPADVAVQWADMTSYTIRFSSFNTPTYSSRSLGYLGLAMYESIVQGDSSHRSMSGQLNGLTLPLQEAGKDYQWLLSLNAAEDTLLKLLYPVPDNSHRYVHQRIDSLTNAVYEKQKNGIDPETVNRSVQFGRAIALAIYQWSLTDGGNEGYKRNFDPAYVFPKGPSYWVPPARGQTVSPFPLHPYWGNNRTFVTSNSTIPIPAIMPFSTDPGSDYYKMYKAVYDKDFTLTLAERETAAWWGDDPTETFSPPGHSYYLATLAIKKSKVGIVKAAEAYARTGMAVADAFINCWKAKVVYFNERPSSFVKSYIDDKWVQFWPEPPFPAFPSGHATQAAASAAVLTDLFGEPFSFTDDSHQGHRRYDDIRFLDLVYPARSFSSFWEAAKECGYSRILGEIHTQQDNDTGMKEGEQVGDYVNALHWLK
jgi:hypothetical protein